MNIQQQFLAADPPKESYIENIKKFCHHLQSLRKPTIMTEPTQPQTVNEVAQKLIDSVEDGRDIMERACCKPPSVANYISPTITFNLEDPVFKHQSDREMIAELQEQFKYVQETGAGSLSEVLKATQDKLDARSAYQKAIEKRKEAEALRIKIVSHIDYIRSWALNTTCKVGTVALVIFPDGTSAAVENTKVLRGTKLLALFWLQTPTQEQRDDVKSTLGVEIFIHTIN